jgi:hypothetical protein
MEALRSVPRGHVEIVVSAKNDHDWRARECCRWVIAVEWLMCFLRNSSTLPFHWLVVGDEGRGKGTVLFLLELHIAISAYEFHMGERGGVVLM